MAYSTQTKKQHFPVFNCMGALMAGNDRPSGSVGIFVSKNGNHGLQLVSTIAQIEQTSSGSA